MKAITPDKNGKIVKKAITAKQQIAHIRRETK